MLVDTVHTAYKETEEQIEVHDWSLKSLCPLKEKAMSQIRGSTRIAEG